MADAEVVIVGAGPAGLSAALWAHTLGLRYVVVEAAPAAGGQLYRVYNPVVDFLGSEGASDGADLARRFMAHVGAAGVRLRTGAVATAVDVARRTVALGGERVAGDFLVLATGVRRRTLGVPGEADVVGRGLSPAAARYAGEFRGRSVLVVGGGDAAFEEALILAEVCERVTLAHRGDAARARPDFRDQATAHPRIEILARTALAAIEGDATVERARIVGPDGERAVDVAGVFVCAGVAANAELVAGQLDLDERGYVVVDSRQRTSADRVYAAGDVCAGSSLTIAAAVGQGAAAVKDVQRRIAAR
jgi:thioredoxin reductase (NADPH)